MIVGLEILSHNKQPHFYLEDVIQKQKNGLLTFIVRVAENKIVDVLVLSYKSYENISQS